MPDRSGLRNEILVSYPPRGVFLEGTLTLNQTPVPGTLMQLQSTGLYSAGCGASNGAIDEVIVLLEDHLSGGDNLTAYANASTTTGGHCFMYIPASGEELQMLVKDISGTGTSENHNIGDLLMAEAASGKLIANSAGAMVPFKVIEALLAPISADTLMLCRYTGQ